MRLFPIWFLWALLLLGRLLLALPVLVRHLNSSVPPSISPINWPRSALGGSDTFAYGNQLLEQILSPQGILAILLLAGGDIIQKAIAQTSGGLEATVPPLVAFSFGWVSYAINAAVTALGEAIFMPLPDCDGHVVTINSGDRRVNQSWIIGRLIRDLEFKIDREVDKNKRDKGLLVAIFKALPDDLNKGHGMLKPKRTRVWICFSIVIILQIIAAIAPWKFAGSRSPYVFGVTMAGICLSFFTSLIVSWDIAKNPPRMHSGLTYAITRGNGQARVFIIMPDTLAVQVDGKERKLVSALPHLEDMATSLTRASKWTRRLTVIIALLWIVLLFAAAGVKTDTGYLLLVGILGMVYNIFFASTRSSLEQLGFPLAPLTRRLSERSDEEGLRSGERSDEGLRSGEAGSTKHAHIIGLKTHNGTPSIMDVLHEVEEQVPGAGVSLLPVFFPGRLTEDQKAKWANHEATIEYRLQKRVHEWYGSG